jgi:hypothetical protein
MAFRFHIDHLPAPGADAELLRDTGVLAYTLIEIARIRCEHLTRSDDQAPAELHRIHRDLGLAGYHAGSDLDPGTRAESLELAHGRCDAYPVTGMRETVEAVYEGAVAAADTLAELLADFDETSDTEQPTDGGQRPLAETHASHLYALSASVLLDSLLSDLGDR